MRRILTYGTFDLFHYGHLSLLKRARDLGDYLFVGLSTDDFNKLKGKKSYFTYAQRLEILNGIKYVDFVFAEENWEQKISDIRRCRVDRFVMGDDWIGKFDHLREYCEVIYLARTNDISSSKIKDDLAVRVTPNDAFRIISR